MNVGGFSAPVGGDSFGLGERIIAEGTTVLTGGGVLGDVTPVLTRNVGEVVNIFAYNQSGDMGWAEGQGDVQLIFIRTGLNTFKWAAVTSAFVGDQTVEWKVIGVPL